MTARKPFIRLTGAKRRGEWRKKVRQKAQTRARQQQDTGAVILSPREEGWEDQTRREGQNDTAGANRAETECRGLALIGEQGGCLRAGSLSQLCWLFPALTEIAQEIRDSGPQKEKMKEAFIHSCCPSKLSPNPSMT